MVTGRLDVRLDPEHRRRLAAVAATRCLPISDIVREMIDRTYEETLAADRLRAALAIGNFAIEDVPDPEALSRQLASTYDTPDLP